MKDRSQRPPSANDTATALRKIYRAFPRLLIAALATGALTFAALTTIAPRYTSHAKLSLLFPKAKPVGTQSPFAFKQTADATHTLQHHISALTASAFLRTVARRHELEKRAEYNPARGSVDMWSRALAAVGLGHRRVARTQDDGLTLIRRNLTVEPVGGTNLIAISFTSIDPKLAAAFANDLARAYSKRLAAKAGAHPVQKQATGRALQLAKLRRQQSALKAKLQLARAAHEKATAAAKATKPNKIRMDGRTAAIHRDLKSAIVQEQQAKAQWQRARALSSSGKAEDLAELRQSQSWQKLKSRRNKVAKELRREAMRLLPAHPRMQNLTARQRRLDRSLNITINKVVADYEKKYREAQLRTAALRSEFERRSNQSQTKKDRTADLGVLKNNTAAAAAELRAIERRIAAVTSKPIITESRAAVQAHVALHAQPPRKPAYPNRPSYALFAGATTFLLGLAMVVLRVSTSGTTIDPLSSRGRSATPKPSGQRRQRNKKPAKAKEPPVDSDRPAAGQDKIGPVLAISEQIAQRDGATGGYRSLFATDSPASIMDVFVIGEYLAARGQSVLVIDWSLTGPTIAPSSEMAIVGITDLLADSAKFEEVIRCLPNSPVQFIAAGQPIEETAILHDPRRLNLVLDVLDEAYDHVIIASMAEPAGKLFAAIEGRVDAGVFASAKEGDHASSAHHDTMEQADEFLGYKVAGIKLYAYASPTQSSDGSGNGN